MSEIEDKIINLESLLAFQDHTIEQLHEVIYKQQQEIDLLNQKVSNVEAMVKSQGSEEKRTLAEEKPPHY